MVDQSTSKLLEAPTIPIGFLNDLNECGSRDEVFRVYAHWSSRISDADRTTVAIANADRDALDLMAIDGNDIIETGTRIPVPGTRLGHVFTTQSPVICEDLRASGTPEDARLVAGGLISSVVVPLSAGQRRFGVVAQAFSEPPPPSANDLMILQAIANCLASHLLIQEQLLLLGEMAMTDPLTRTFNRRVFDDQVARLWSELMTNGTRFCLAQVDLDHFKQINDSFGHDFGDQVLKGVAEALMSICRASDTVVRMGGEEFCVILAATTLPQAEVIAERLRKAIGALAWTANGREVSVTASIGLAEAWPGHDSPRFVAMKADEALYNAKKRGRDRVCNAAA